MYLPRIVEHLHAQAQQRQLELEGVQLSRGGCRANVSVAPPALAIARIAESPKKMVRSHARSLEPDLRHHQRAVPTAGSYNRQTQVKVKHVDGKRPPRTNCVPLRYTWTTKSVTAHDWGVGHHLAGCRGLSL